MVCQVLVCGLSRASLPANCEELRANDSYWTEAFARNPRVVGRTIKIKGVPFEIIGVAAPSFIGVENDNPTDVWIPLQTNPLPKPWSNVPQEQYSLHVHSICGV
jgi:hypothetical protein